MQNTMLLTDMATRNIAVRNTAFTLHKIGVAKVGPGNGPAAPNVIHFKVDGADHYAILDTRGTPYADIPAELLSKGMEGTALVIPDWLRFMALPSKLLRNGIVYNPAYPWAALFKDSLSLGASRGGSFSNIVNLMRGIKNYATGAEQIEELHRRGITGSTMFTGTIEDVAIARRRAVDGEGTWERLVAAQEARNIKADGATRLALYNEYVKKGLNTRDATYMTITAMPYSRRGLSPGMRYLSMMIPFFNAQIVGLNSLYQGLTGKVPFNDKLQIQKKMWGAGMMMGVSTLAYAAMVSDEEWYKNLPAETRLRNWLIKLPGMEEPLSIPIPFEYGIMFKSLFEAAATGMFDDSPEGAQVRKAMKSMVLGAIPGGVVPLEGVPVVGAVPAGPMASAALKPVLELVSNKSWFNDAPIETQADLAIDPEHRAHVNTTGLAKTLGSTMGVSPIQIDHLIRGYTGTLGAAVASLVGAMAEKPTQEPDTPMSKTPIVGQFFKPVDANAVINTAMDTLLKYQKSAATLKHLQEQPGGEREAAEYEAQHGEEIAKGKLAGTFRQVLGQFKKQELAIRNGDGTAAEKRQQLKELQQYKIEQAKQFLEEARI
jgi:hypothetical protein